MLLKVEFMPKFSVRGIWQRWRESYPPNGSKADDAITVFTGVSFLFALSMHILDPVFFNLLNYFCFIYLFNLACFYWIVNMVHCLRSWLLVSVLTTGHLVLYSLISWPAKLLFGSRLAKVVSVLLLSKFWALMSLLVRRRHIIWLLLITWN